jgi:predicted PurR-regulated permease PerM
MRAISGYAVLVLGTIAGLAILWQFREAALLFLLSLVVAAAFRPAIDTLAHRGLSRGMALGVVYFAFIALAVTLLLLTSGPLLNDLEVLANRLAQGYEGLKQTWPENGSLFQRTLAERLPPAEELYASLAGQGGSQIWPVLLPAVLGVTTNLLGFLTRLVIVLVLSVYWSADSLHFERLWLSLVPVERRARARQAWRAMETSLGTYIRSELSQSILAGVLLYAGYSLIGLDYPLLLAAAGAVAWLIPWFGALIALAPAVWVGLSLSPLHAVLAAACVLLVLAFLELVVERRLFPNHAYSSVLLVIVALALADAFGLLGFVLAPLLAAAVQITFKEMVSPPNGGMQHGGLNHDRPPDVAEFHYGASRDPAAALVTDSIGRQSHFSPECALEQESAIQERLEQMLAIAAEMNGELPPEIASLMRRMQRLVEESHAYE